MSANPNQRAHPCQYSDSRILHYVTFETILATAGPLPSEPEKQKRAAADGFEASLASARYSNRSKNRERECLLKWRASSSSQATPALVSLLADDRRVISVQWKSP